MKQLNLFEPQELQPGDSVRLRLDEFDELNGSTAVILSRSRRNPRWWKVETEIGPIFVEACRLERLTE